jgi:hypothetical protein
MTPESCAALAIYTRAFLTENGAPPPSDLWCITLREDGEELGSLCSLSLIGTFLESLAPDTITIHFARGENIELLQAVVERAAGGMLLH